MELEEVLAAREGENLALLRALGELKTRSARLESDCQVLAAQLALANDGRLVEEQESRKSIRDSDPRLRECVGLVKSHAEHRISLPELVAAVQRVADAGGVTEGGEVVVWKARAVELEQLLHAAAAKNLAFEDTVAALEVQVRTMEREWDELQSDKPLEAIRKSVYTSISQMQAVHSPREAPVSDQSTRQLEIQIEKLKKEMSRLRLATQRKAELLGFEKQKAEALRQRLEAFTASNNELAAAQSQLSELRAKSKEQARQLQELRAVSSACHEDNVQLAFRLQQVKQEQNDSAKRIKSLVAENQRLRSETGMTFNPSSSTVAMNGSTYGGGKRPQCSKCGSRVTGEASTSVDEEVKALRRRVLQKQELLVQSKAKIASLEKELVAERATNSRLTRTNRQLEQTHKLQLANSANALTHVQSESKMQLDLTQQQLDGLRASVFDAFEAIISCQPMMEIITGKRANASNQEIVDSDSSGDEKLDKAQRWTDFSSDDLASLRVSGSKREVAAIERYRGQLLLEAKSALKSLGAALDRWPQDCRNEVCQVIQVLLDQSNQPRDRQAYK